MKTKLELKASITQQTENRKVRDNYWNSLGKKENRLLIGNLNINSICSKFDQTKCLLKGKIDSLTITENKSDISFTITKLFIDGYSKPFRFDRNRNAVGILLYVREDIVSRELKSDNLPVDINKIFIELNLSKV